MQAFGKPERVTIVATNLMAAEDVLAKVQLFSQLTRRDLATLAKLAVNRNFKKGDEIVKAGDGAIAFYVISSGRVDVIRGDTKLASFGSGGYFGEMALLDNSLRSATVRAADDTECLVLSKWDFNAEVNRPGSRVALSLLPILAGRIRKLEDAATH
jgi:CRP/FNR family cyclic AMP-dependent transcriptional regulator